jgi:hypothetical protein
LTFSNKPPKCLIRARGASRPPAVLANAPAPQRRLGDSRGPPRSPKSLKTPMRDNLFFRPPSDPGECSCPSAAPGRLPQTSPPTQATTPPESLWVRFGESKTRDHVAPTTSRPFQPASDTRPTIHRTTQLTRPSAGRPIARPHTYPDVATSFPSAPVNGDRTVRFGLDGKTTSLGLQTSRGSNSFSGQRAMPKSNTSEKQSRCWQRSDLKVDAGTGGI